MRAQGGVWARNPNTHPNPSPNLNLSPNPSPSPSPNPDASGFILRDPDSFEIKLGLELGFRV